jgi:peptidoglycan hydrolase CwlO-like protein
MKKILLMLVVFIVLFLILIFKAPVVADKIWNLFWFYWVSENIVNIKNKFDNAITRIPSKEEVIQTYDMAYSWTVNAIDKTKDTIDNVRENANKIEEKYNNAKEFIDDTWKKIDEVKSTINDLEQIWNNIKNIVNTWAVN